MEMCVCTARIGQLYKRCVIVRGVAFLWAKTTTMSPHRTGAEVSREFVRAQTHTHKITKIRCHYLTT